jgi:hypothetical protein
LEPVLDHFLVLLDKPIEKISIISDSPSSQYRNRKTLYIVDRVLRLRNIIRWQWMYTEAGHGKGAADGVGAAIKRRCDRLVSTGEMKQIVTAEDVQKATEIPEKLNIAIFRVTANNIAKYTQALGVVRLQTMPGISNAHFVSRTASGVLYRELTCLCDDGSDDCMCHNKRYWQLLDIPLPPDPDEPSVSGANTTDSVRGRPRSRRRPACRNRGRKSESGATCAHHQVGIQFNPAVSISFQ